MGESKWGPDEGEILSAMPAGLCAVLILSREDNKAIRYFLYLRKSRLVRIGYVKFLSKYWDRFVYLEYLKYVWYGFAKHNASPMHIS